MVNFLFIFAFVPLFWLQIQYFFQKTYHVHKDGIVLITGASTGIGRHAAEYLADHTNFTVYAGVRKERDINDILSLNKPNLIPILLDVTSKESIEAAIKVIQASSKPFVALVNNAGISRGVVFEAHDIDDAKTVFETNVFGVLRLTQLALPYLRQSQGRVVMISSVAGKIGIPKMGVYAGSKFALEALSDSLRREVAHMNISVSIIEPGYVKTPIFDSSKASSMKVYEEISLDIKNLYSKFFR